MAAGIEGRVDDTAPRATVAEPLQNPWFRTVSSIGLTVWSARRQICAGQLSFQRSVITRP